MIDINQERDRQRFIDGELSIEQENDAIIQCEINPELWRAVAVSMIEQRRLSSALQQISDGHPSPTVARTARDTVSRAKPVGRRWVTAASILALFAVGSIAYLLGRTSAKSDTPLAKNAGPVLVQVEYTKQPPTASTIASFHESMFAPQAHAAFEEAGLRVNETLKWEFVNDGNRRIAVPNREVRFVSLRP